MNLTSLGFKKPSVDPTVDAADLNIFVGDNMDLLDSKLTIVGNEVGILSNLTTVNKSSLVNSSIEETSRRKDIGINIKDFGAVLDGVTDDSTAFINAIAALATTGGTIFVPSGVSCITQTLNINNPNIYLIGNGSDYNHDLGTTVGGTVLKWTGATGGGSTMINISAVSGASDRALANPSVQNISLDCNSKADYALKIFSVRKGIFTDLLINNPLVAGIQTGVVASLGEARDTQFCKFSNISMRLIEAPIGKGIQITGDASANTSFNLFSQIDITHLNGTGIEMGGSDNNQFLCIRVNRAGGGTGIGIDLLASSASSGQAATAIYLTQISAGIGGTTLRGNTYSANAFVSGYGRGNGEPIPTVEAGASVYYNDEYNFNSGFLFGATVFSEDETTARAERVNLGVNSQIIRNNSGGGTVYSDGTNKFLLRMNNPNFELVRLAGTGTFVLPTGTSIATNAPIQTQLDTKMMSLQSIINSNMAINQTGLSYSNPTNNLYTLDMWVNQFVNTGTLPTTITHSQNTLTSGELFNSYYSYQVSPNGAGGGFGASDFYGQSQRIEFGTRYLAGSGKTVSISFEAKSSIASKRIAVGLKQIYGTGGSPTSAEILTPTATTIRTLTPTMALYTFTFTTNTLTGKTFGTNNDDCLELTIYEMWGSTYATNNLGGGTAETFVGSGNINFTAVQFNAGSTALAFQPKATSEELLSCQRYLRLLNSYNRAFFNAGNTFGTAKYFDIPMRSIPTLNTTYLGTYGVGGANPAANQWNLWYPQTGTSITWGTSPGGVASDFASTTMINLYISSGTTPSVGTVGAEYSIRFGVGSMILFEARL